MTLAYLIAKDIFDKRPLGAEAGSETYSQDGDVEYKHTIFAYTAEMFQRVVGEDKGGWDEEPYFDTTSEVLEISELNVNDIEGYVHVNYKEVQACIDKMLV